MSNSLRAFDKDGNEVKIGDEVIDFRGDAWTFQSVTNWSKIHVISQAGWSREFYAHVFGLTIKQI